MNRTISALCLALLFSCGPDAERALSEVEETESISDSVEAVTVISFKSDWTVTVSGPLTKGTRVRVQYDSDRLPVCRGTNNSGGPAWGITGYYALNRGPVGYFEAGGFSPSQGSDKPEFVLGSEGDLAIWFQITNLWGCTAFDSNFGYNFHFKVSGAPTVSFNGNWTVSKSGSFSNASVIAVSYDLSRLPNCRATYNGIAAWDIVAFYRFDGGAVSYQAVTSPNGSSRLPTPAMISVPDGANELELWFQNSDRQGCRAYDSQFGYNYRFRLP